MTGLAGWIKRHEVLSFFVLVYAISWPAMYVVMFLFPRSMLAGATLGLAAAFSPVLVGMLISAIKRPGRRNGGRRARWTAFGAAWVLSWVVFVLNARYAMRVDLGPHGTVVSGVVALLPAWIISAALSRMEGVRGYLVTLLRPRGSALWYLAAFLIFPAVQLAGAGITTLMGGHIEFDASSQAPGAAAAFLALTFMRVFLQSGGINEESGWRGFALSRLQKRLPVITAAIVVWILWALWHLPYDIALGTPLEAVLTNRLFYNLLWSILLAWVYNRTRGSILAPAILHASMNTFGDYLPRTGVATVIFVILTASAVLEARMWRRHASTEP